MNKDLKNLFKGLLISIITITIICRIVEGHFPFESYFHPYQTVEHFHKDGFVLNTYYKGETTYCIGYLNEIEKIKDEEKVKFVELIDKANELSN